uniref:Transmembrane protein n=1 Tax=Chromera velia CCMP2878 TaxID=1169474 RepID=A0A0G4I5J3_9ALVE|eukprot:Cvel_11186.t1-p1 / transcript=Cvel_11186.t1 / gene=Cvel_11186 / organism=Chromera_velia_CCMP2878 / gene_product=hypothetical protein / transcript_product=hypothetical protein / location=Cvel_scaffold694:51580-57595(+) / protein_length=1666 / sequence_SO=supercontig / SO=protein_coding / is_pseudo=false
MFEGAEVPKVQKHPHQYFWERPLFTVRLHDRLWYLLSYLIFAVVPFGLVLCVGSLAQGQALEPFMVSAVVIVVVGLILSCSFLYRNVVYLEFLLPLSIVVACVGLAVLLAAPEGEISPLGAVCIALGMGEGLRLVCGRFLRSQIVPGVLQSSVVVVFRLVGLVQTWGLLKVSLEGSLRLWASFGGGGGQGDLGGSVPEAAAVIWLLFVMAANLLSKVVPLLLTRVAPIPSSGGRDLHLGVSLQSMSEFGYAFFLKTAVVVPWHGWTVLGVVVVGDLVSECVWGLLYPSFCRSRRERGGKGFLEKGASTETEGGKTGEEGGMGVDAVLFEIYEANETTAKQVGCRVSASGFALGVVASVWLLGFFQHPPPLSASTEEDSGSSPFVMFLFAPHGGGEAVVRVFVSLACDVVVLCAALWVRRGTVVRKALREASLLIFSTPSDSNFPEEDLEGGRGGGKVEGGEEVSARCSEHASMHQKEEGRAGTEILTAGCIGVQEGPVGASQGQPRSRPSIPPLQLSSLLLSGSDKSDALSAAAQEACMETKVRTCAEICEAASKQPEGPGMPTCINNPGPSSIGPLSICTVPHPSFGAERPSVSSHDEETAQLGDLEAPSASASHSPVAVSFLRSSSSPSDEERRGETQTLAAVAGETEQEQSCGLIEVASENALVDQWILVSPSPKVQWPRKSLVFDPELTVRSFGTPSAAAAAAAAAAEENVQKSREGGQRPEVHRPVSPMGALSQWNEERLPDASCVRGGSDEGSCSSSLQDGVQSLRDPPMPMQQENGGTMDKEEKGEEEDRQSVVSIGSSFLDVLFEGSCAASERSLELLCRSPPRLFSRDREQSSPSETQKVTLLPQQLHHATPPSPSRVSSDLNENEEDPSSLSPSPRTSQSSSEDGGEGKSENAHMGEREEDWGDLESVPDSDDFITPPPVPHFSVLAAAGGTAERGRLVAMLSSAMPLPSVGSQVPPMIGSSPPLQRGSDGVAPPVCAFSDERERDEEVWKGEDFPPREQAESGRFPSACVGDTAVAGENEGVDRRDSNPMVCREGGGDRESERVAIQGGREGERVVLLLRERGCMEGEGGFPVEGRTESLNVSIVNAVQQSLFNSSSRQGELEIEAGGDGGGEGQLHPREAETPQERDFQGAVGHVERGREREQEYGNLYEVAEREGAFSSSSARSINNSNSNSWDEAEAMSEAGGTVAGPNRIPVTDSGRVQVSASGGGVCFHPMPPPFFHVDGKQTSGDSEREETNRQADECGRPAVSPLSDSPDKKERPNSCSDSDESLSLSSDGDIPPVQSPRRRLEGTTSPSVGSPKSPVPKAFNVSGGGPTCGPKPPLSPGRLPPLPLPTPTPMSPRRESSPETHTEKKGPTAASQMRGYMWGSFWTWFRGESTRKANFRTSEGEERKEDDVTKGKWSLGGLCERRKKEVRKAHVWFSAKGERMRSVFETGYGESLKVPPPPVRSELARGGVRQREWEQRQRQVMLCRPQATEPRQPKGKVPSSPLSQLAEEEEKRKEKHWESLDLLESGLSAEIGTGGGETEAGGRQADGYTEEFAGKDNKRQGGKSATGGEQAERRLMSRAEGLLAVVTRLGASKGYETTRIEGGGVRVPSDGEAFEALRATALKVCNPLSMLPHGAVCLLTTDLWGCLDGLLLLPLIGLGVGLQIL